MKRFLWNEQQQQRRRRRRRNVSWDKTRSLICFSWLVLCFTSKRMTVTAFSIHPTTTNFHSHCDRRYHCRSSGHCNAGGHVGHVLQQQQQQRQQLKLQSTSSNHHHDDHHDESDETKEPSSSTTTTTRSSTRNNNNNDNKAYFFYSPEQVQQLKDSVDIVSVAESFQLQQFSKTNNYNNHHRRASSSSTSSSATAICPFHNDRNPSLRIDSSKQIYKCFSCGAGGDVFQFVRSISDLQSSSSSGGGGGGGGGGKGSTDNSGMTFYQAVHYVAQEFGGSDFIASTSTTTKGTATGGTFSSSSSTNESNQFKQQQLQLQQQKQDRLYACHAAAVQFYRKALIHIPSAGAARSHLQHGRQLSPPTVRTYALGYAPDAYYDMTTTTTSSSSSLSSLSSSSSSSWGEHSLVQHLKSLGFSANDILQSGLAKQIKKKTTKYTKKNSHWNEIMVSMHHNQTQQKPSSSSSSSLSAAASTLTSKQQNRTPNKSDRDNNNNSTLTTATTTTTNTDIVENKKSVYNNEDDNNEDEEDMITYDCLMDRFRKRIMVPIFDESGRHVIAFGGRIIPPKKESIENKNNNNSSNNNSNKDNTTTATSSNFVPPKYLNSPETPIFSKKDELFGLHLAKAAIQEEIQKKKEQQQQQQQQKQPQNVAKGQQNQLQALSFLTRNGHPTIVIVEGYMDVMAMWEAGIRNVVASMGTALTMNQLHKAARAMTLTTSSTVQYHHNNGVSGGGGGGARGRMILCLDNDDAGIMAMERVCSNQFISRLSEEYPLVEVFVATLPDQIKDPGEFFEASFLSPSEQKQQRQSGTKKRHTNTKKEKTDATTTASVGEQFQKQVLHTAMEWSQWYTRRIMSRYDPSISTPSGPGSFADICERLSDFLATFPTPVDRTKRAYEIASELARIVMKKDHDDNDDTLSSTTFKTLQIQLESDLVNMVQRKATIKGMVERRVESVEGYDSQNKTAILKRMLHGGQSTEVDESDKLARNATNNKMSTSTPADSRNDVPFTKKSQDQRTFRESTNFGAKTRGSRTKMKRKALSKRQQEPMTPYFTGLPVTKPSDAAWLGVTRDKSFHQVRGLTFGGDRDKNDKYKRLVLFNSNDYHGDQYLTEEASMAGYNKGKIERDASMLEKGIGVLIKENQEQKAAMAEERMLRALVQYAPARSAMAAAVSSGDATGSRPEIEWSSNERAWLFEMLVFRCNDIPKEVATSEDSEGLWLYLSSRSDAPNGAFQSNPFDSNLSAPDVVLEHESQPSLLSKDRRPKKNEHLNAMDANIVDSSTNTSIESIPAVSIPSTRDDIDDWASSYDPFLFDEFNVPNNDTFLKEIDSMQHTNLEDVIGSGTVIDAILQSASIDENVDSTQPQEQQQAHLQQRSGSQKNAGTLDDIFLLDEDIFSYTYDESVERSYRAELEVQEALAYLLRASAAKKLSSVNSNWLLVSKILDARLGVVIHEEQQRQSKHGPSDKKKKIQIDDVICGIEEIDSMNLGDLKLYHQSILIRLQQLHTTVQQLDASAKQISLRLMEYSQGDATEGRMISVSKQQRLAQEIDDFVQDLPADYQPKELDDNLSILDPMYVLSLYLQPGDKKKNENDSAGSTVPMQEEYDSVQEEIAYREDMLMMKQTWGDLVDNDNYVWSMPLDESESHRIMPGMNELMMEEEMMYGGEEESLEETLARIDEEWGDWEDYNVLENPNLRQAKVKLLGVQENDTNDGASIGVESMPATTSPDVNDYTEFGLSESNDFDSDWVDDSEWE